MTGFADDGKLDMVQLYLSQEREITFPLAKAAVVKAYSRIGRASPFDAGATQPAPAKQEVTQGEVNSELLSFFRGLRMAQPQISTNLFDAFMECGARRIPAMVTAQSTGKEMRQYNIDAMQPQANKPLSLKTMHGFPVERRPQLRELSKAGKAEIGTWFSASEIAIEAMAHNRECVNAAKRLLYTWRDCFVKSMREVNPPT